MLDSSGMNSVHMNPLLTQGTMNHGNVDLGSAANESAYLPQQQDNIKVQIGSEDIHFDPAKDIEESIQLKKKQLEESLKKK
jgi:hypothetical protein